LLAIFVALNSLYATADDLNARKEHIKKMETRISKLAKNRKSRSETILKKLNVPINIYLPYIEDENEALLRTKEEIANRALTLLIVALKAEGLEQDTLISLIKDYDLKKHLSPKESTFINEPNPSQFDKTQFIWRYEAAWTLLWALGYIPELSPPTETCDVPAAVSFMRDRTKVQFIQDAKLKSISDILNENDLIYRYHWAVVGAKMNGLNIPLEIDSSVVMERHYVLNWLIGYMNQEWDYVSTDT
jgi:hypothetical protein